MLNRFTLSDTNTFDEVNKALNLLVDAHNENELELSLVKPKKKPKKKKGGK